MSNVQNMSDLMSYSSNSSCPICHGLGYVFPQITNEFTKQVYGDERLIEFSKPCSYCNGGHAQKVRERKERANIPSSFYTSSINDFIWDLYKDNHGNIINTSKQRQIVESFIDKFDTWQKRGVGLYIYSKMRGSGKTYLASCICNSLINKYPMNTKFVSASELIDIQKKGLNTGTEYDVDPIKLLCDCKLLVIDDLGQKQSGADWTNDILFRIFDNRYQEKLITVITSNIPILDLSLDDRVVDRINSMCSPLPLPEFCVRSREAKNNQIQLFRELGLIKEA